MALRKNDCSLLKLSRKIKILYEIFEENFGEQKLVHIVTRGL
jgi:hypothetical protein